MGGWREAKGAMARRGLGLEHDEAAASQLTPTGRVGLIDIGDVAILQPQLLGELRGELPSRAAHADDAQDKKKLKKFCKF